MKSQMKTRRTRATTAMPTNLISLEGFALTSIYERDSSP